MADLSELDQRYFIDEHVYNCPFCNRRNVAYHIRGQAKFDWTNDRTCYVFFVRCESCACDSMHLSFEDLETFHYQTRVHGNRWRFRLSEEDESGIGLDDAFFYSVPTSFFVLDTRVPKVLRELLTEAEGCQKSNFLTGASACARKIVYELAVLNNASGDNYEDRIKSLKKTHPEIESAFFDTLLTIQQVTSSKVHENAYDNWQAKHIRIILASLSEVLHEMYVVPALRQDRRKSILSLKEELLGESPKVNEDPEDSQKA